MKRFKASANMCLILIVLFGFLLNQACKKNDSKNTTGSVVNSWRLLGSTGISDGLASEIDLAVSPSGVAYIAYQDYGSNSRGTNVKKLTGTNWVDVGNLKSYTERYGLKLAFSPNNIPYLAFHEDHLRVLKFDGVNWSDVDTTGLSGVYGDMLGFAISPDGKLFISYRDWSQSGNASVKTYNGTEWEYVGNPGFSNTPIWYSNLAFNTNGTLYLCYTSEAFSGKATVLKYYNNAWIYVGTQGFSSDDVNYLGLALSPSGTPYVAFQDITSSYAPTVMKYNGSNWNIIGSPGFASASTFKIDMMVNSNEEPFVAFDNYSDSNKVMVMKFNGSSWNDLNVPKYHDFQGFPSIVIGANGQLFVAFSNSDNMNKATVLNYGYYSTSEK